MINRENWLLQQGSTCLSPWLIFTIWYVTELTWSVLLLLDLILFQIVLIEFLFFWIVYDQ
jgi:hypothetical protein